MPVWFWRVARGGAGRAAEEDQGAGERAGQRTDQAQRGTDALRRRRQARQPGPLHYTYTVHYTVPVLV